ncbi:unnamed protein product [Paramecium primaurelia]|uniref:Uncharacterized protein n=1 Tax=Paramecium primaurelia TaxID=5886 RepID=A0A8S1NQA4_PARPR|nr:unnamed protein product [Paramecium primaurelia]
MNNQQENQISNGIEYKIEQIYDNLLPPAHFRSNIKFYDEEKEMRRDCESHFFSNYQIENIQYQLEIDKIKNDKEKSAQKGIFHFNIKNLLPKSQLLDPQPYVKSQYGCKILKTKASNTKMELHLENDSKNNQKQQIYVFLGQVTGKFKIRLSNYELLEYNI